MSLPRACSSSPAAPPKNTTNARVGRERSGKIATMPQRSKVTSNLHRCLVYIDLNMVRAGVVNHPGQWKEGGFAEIQKQPKRYAIIDLQSLSEVSGFPDFREFQSAHRQWIEQGLGNTLAVRDDRWSGSIAVGSLAFVENVETSLVSKPRIVM